MGKHCQLPELRKKLDEAITYGSKRAAWRLAKSALSQAKGKGLPGEIEYFKGQAQLLKENFSAAIEHFDAAIRFNPYDGGAYNDRALSMAELGIIDGALDYFNRGISVEPGFATIYHNKGWLLNNIGRHSEAIGCFKKALELEPQRPVTYDNLADALFNLGDYRAACRAYEKVIALLEPGSSWGIRKQIRARIREIKSKLKEEEGNGA